MELLLKHGGRIDVEARMCWPGPHNQNCEERFKNCKAVIIVLNKLSILIFCILHLAVPDESLADRSSDKLQSAIYYGIDGDQVFID